MRVINCYKCGKYLGEIRDAKLHKDMYFICGHCAMVKTPPKDDYSNMFKGDNFTNSIFGDLFGGKK